MKKIRNYEDKVFENDEGYKTNIYLVESDSREQNDTKAINGKVNLSSFSSSSVQVN